MQEEHRAESSEDHVVAGSTLDTSWSILRRIHDHVRICECGTRTDYIRWRVVLRWLTKVTVEDVEAMQVALTNSIPADQTNS